MKNTTKVLHVIGGGEFGGAEQHLVTLLKSIDKKKFDVEVVCLFAEPLVQLLERENIPNQVFSMTSKIDLGVITKLSRYMQKRQFNIVHTHGVRANLVGRLAARKAGIENVVTTVHSVLDFDYPRKKDLWMNKLSEKLTFGITKHFIAVSNKLAKYISETYGLSKRKVSVIHNGLELEKFNVKGNRAKIRKEFGIAEDEIVIGVISRLHPVKGHSILFQACENLISKLPSVKLLIVGTGPEKENLQDLVEKLGISQHVIFAGFRKDVIDILAGIDILVQPSLSEGFGLTLLEGMAMKKPVVASDVGGIPEIIEDRYNGLLVPAGDPLALAEAVTSLWELPQMPIDLAEAGRQTVEKKFSADIMARKTEDVYKRLINKQIRKSQRGKI